MNARTFFSLLAGALIFSLTGSIKAQERRGPLPNRDQQAWHRLDYYWFIHFGPNTFYNQEWGEGTEDPGQFNPSQLDCRQWARIAKASGAKGIIITAKHHDGFCLWPTKYSTHTVRESKWRNGQGDVLKDLSQACKEYGLLFGIYISPWDRNHPQYGTPGYNDVYVNTMQEAVRQYGPIFEMWWDGANGEGPNGKKQEYDFPRFERAIREVAPHAVVFSDIGPDIRWVGNESGFAGETNWNLLDTAGFKRGAGGPPQDTLNQGNVHGKNWIPAECDVSIRPGWFYHASEDNRVKTPEQLMALYLKSVGRGANLLLNVPPDTRGLIHENDSAAVMGFHQLRENFFRENLALQAAAFSIQGGKNVKLPALTDGNRDTYVKLAAGDSGSIEVKLNTPREFNTIALAEFLGLGQQVSAFKVELWVDQNFVEVARGTTIGNTRILQFPRHRSDRVRVTILSSKAAPALGEISLYNAPAY